MMKTIKENIINELVVNKSKFITYLVRVNNEEEVKEILDSIKKEYKDATHYCYAYIIDNYKRFNDDGEPSGTAGIPIMNVLDKRDLNHILCVVVRYFGGIKLGAGGLSRTYTKSVTGALNKTPIANLIEAIKIKITCPYEKTKELEHILNDSQINNKKYDINVIYIVDIKKNIYENIRKDLLLIKEIELDELHETYIEE